jgi:hypothetical protein
MNGLALVDSIRRAVHCTDCGAAAGFGCSTEGGARLGAVHDSRLREYERKAGFEPHSLVVRGAAVVAAQRVTP